MKIIIMSYLSSRMTIVAILIMLIVASAASLPGFTSATVPVINERVTSSGSSGTMIPSISKDGRFVAFVSDSTSLVPGDTNGVPDVFVKDMDSGNTTRVNVSSTGAQSNSPGFAETYWPRISSDGRYVVFASKANNLVSPAIPDATNVYIHDRQSGHTELVSFGTGGQLPSSNNVSNYPDISRDGRYVVFNSTASNLVSGDTNNSIDTFVRDRVNGTTTRVNVTNSGLQSTGGVDMPRISCDGAYIAFRSNSTDLTPGDTNSQGDIFLIERIGGHTVTNITGHATLPGQVSNQYINVSCDGSTVVFSSDALNMVAGDTTSAGDSYSYNVNSKDLQIVAKNSSGSQPNSGAGRPMIAANSNCVLFFSGSNNMGAGASTSTKMYVRDIKNSAVDVLSIKNLSPTQYFNVNVSAGGADISDDGRYVVSMTNEALVSGDTDVQTDIYRSATGLSGCSL